MFAVCLMLMVTMAIQEGNDEFRSQMAQSSVHIILRYVSNLNKICEHEL